jgi:hypothetical protein
MHSAVCFSWLQRWYSSRHRHTSNAALCIKLIALSVAGEELITAAYCIFTMYLYTVAFAVTASSSSHYIYDCSR